MPSMRSDGAAHPVAADQLEQDLGIRAIAQSDAGAAQIVGECLVAIDLTVEDEGVAGRFVDPRLGPAREIDDRQPRMAEGDPVIDEDAAAVRPAMRQCPVHPGEYRSGLGAGCGEPGYAAHCGATTGEVRPGAAPVRDARPPVGSCKAAARAPRNKCAPAPRR